MAIAASGDSKAPRFRHHNAKRARKRARSNAISPRYSNLTIELTFFGDTFKCLARTLDAVLMLVAFQWQQFYDLKRAIRAETAKWA
jgi:hypothetical protein